MEKVSRGIVGCSFSIFYFVVFLYFLSIVTSFFPFFFLFLSPLPAESVCANLCNSFTTEEEEDDPSEEEDVPLKGYLQPSMRGGKKDSPFNIRTECVVKRAVRCLNTAKVAATCSIIYQKVEELFPESVKRLSKPFLYTLSQQ